METFDAEIKHTFTLTYKRKFNSSTRVNRKSFFFFLRPSGLTSQWFRINFLLPFTIFKSQKASFSLKNFLNPHKNYVEKRDNKFRKSGWIVRLFHFYFKSVSYIISRKIIISNMLSSMNVCTYYILLIGTHCKYCT